MTEEKLRSAIHQAIDRRLSGVQGDPYLAARALKQAQEKAPRKRKLSASLILALALALLTASVALATGLGLFGQLADLFDFEKRLSGLDAVSQPVGVTVTTDDGITVTIDQAYYEGERVFIAYRLSGSLYKLTLHEGAPPAGTHWNWEMPDTVYSESMLNVAPYGPALGQWLNGEGQRWAELWEASLHDGLSLADGTYLDIIGGDFAWQEDGSVIGWKECTIPQDRLADTLDFKAVLFRLASIDFQDQTTYRLSSTLLEQTDIPFTLTRNNRFSLLSGEGAGEGYQARVELKQGQIDLKGQLVMQCPAAWVQAFEDWESPDGLDRIDGWALYSGDQPVGGYGIEGIWSEGDALFYDLLYPRLEDLDHLQMVPEYTLSGARLEEGIALMMVEE